MTTGDPFILCICQRLWRDAMLTGVFLGDGTTQSPRPPKQQLREILGTRPISLGWSAPGEQMVALLFSQMSPNWCRLQISNQSPVGVMGKRKNRVVSAFFLQSSLSQPSPQSQEDIDLEGPWETLHIPSKLSWPKFYILELISQWGTVVTSGIPGVELLSLKLGTSLVCVHKHTQRNKEE